MKQSRIAASSSVRRRAVHPSLWYLISSCAKRSLLCEHKRDNEQVVRQNHVIADGKHAHSCDGNGFEYRPFRPLLYLRDRRRNQEDGEHRIVEKEAIEGPAQASEQIQQHTDIYDEREPRQDWRGMGLRL